jgi:hypothetical protein
LNSELIKLKKLSLQATLLENLQLLQGVMPDIYNEFKSYTPSETGVIVDTDGNLNLYNNQKSVYPFSPEKFADEQVAQFLKKPDVFRYHIGHQDDKDIVFKHAALLKSIYNVRKEETKNELLNPANEPRLDFVCMLGGGLGYQIKSLFEAKPVLNFFLFEPCKDTFFALLHCVELKPLFEHCSKQGGRFSIFVGGSSDAALNNISHFLFQQGHFNLSRMLFFTHYESKTINETIQRVKDIGHRLSAGWGFMEDEIIGMTHTLTNIDQGFPVLKSRKHFKSDLKDFPVFVCANGPSLDSAIEFLKENQNNIFIVSAGTALKALLANDIKPDIHVEMERAANVLDWVSVVTRTEELKYGLKDLRIFALNTVFNGVLSEFKSAYLLAKNNDAGGRLIRLFDEKGLYAYPEFSNPTASNTALSVAVELGFEDVYLVGMDFGYIDEAHHHSKHSIYYDDDFKHKELVKKIMRSDIEVKGNFRDTVFSTSIFDSSKGNIELLLSQDLFVNAKNTADGAFIKSANPCSIESIKIKNKIEDKDKILEKQLRLSTSNKQLEPNRLNTNLGVINNSLKQILEEILSFTACEFNTREQLADAFTIQNRLLHQLKESKAGELIYWTVQGTFRYFQAYIMTNSYYYDCIEKRAEFINACINAFHQHVNDVYLEYMEFYNKPSHL